MLGGLIFETMLDRLTQEQRAFIPIYTITENALIGPRAVDWGGGYGQAYPRDSSSFGTDHNDGHVVFGAALTDLGNLAHLNEFVNPQH